MAAVTNDQYILVKIRATVAKDIFNLLLSQQNLLGIDPNRLPPIRTIKCLLIPIPDQQLYQIILEPLNRNKLEGNKISKENPP